MAIFPLPRIGFTPFPDIKELHPVALLYSRPAWESVKEIIRLPIVWQAEITQATESQWLALENDLIHAGIDLTTLVIYTIGGGLVADAGKYIASKVNLPLFCLPTALSVDAFFTWSSGVRISASPPLLTDDHQNLGCVSYLKTKPPDQVIIDFDVIADGPPSVRAAGICDVLSIATGSWDWRYAEEQGQNSPDMAYVPYVAQTAQAIYQGALDCAEAAGRGDRAGLRQLLDCLALETQLCNQIGHARPEEGSEHYFAYAVENFTGSGLPHGDLVGPGILVIAERQGQDTTLIRRALSNCKISLDRIPNEIVVTTLTILPAYVRRFDLPFGIAHTLFD